LPKATHFPPRKWGSLELNSGALSLPHINNPLEHHLALFREPTDAWTSRLAFSELPSSL
jgi:hypothetical protein